MAQHGFQSFGSAHGVGSIDPSDLDMSGNYGSGYQDVSASSNNNNFSTGSALFGDDELLEGLDGHSGMQGQSHDFGAMNGMGMGYHQNNMYAAHHGLPSNVDHSRLNGYSNTPDGDPIQSPFVHGYGQFRQMQQPQSFGTSLQSPISYAGSPLAGSDLNGNGNGGNNDGGAAADAAYLNAKARVRMSQAAGASSMQRKPSHNSNGGSVNGNPANAARTPLTPKTSGAMASMSLDAQNTYGAQPIRNSAPHHDKSQSAGQWLQTPNSLTSFPGSAFSSPMQPGMQSAQINEMLLKGGASMPAKLSGGPGMTSTQEAKRKRRRESHNLVERRRRDNINERIQDLSKLVPAHRLEDEKIKKLIQNGTPLSPTLTGVSSPSQATSALAGPGAKRATGNITTGLPLDDKDKGPNKGDILNGAVSWTRDLMWLLRVKLSQQDELLNQIVELGGQVSFEMTEDERRMQTELEEAVRKNEESDPQTKFTYSRYAGSGLRVPQHTDYKGDPVRPDDNLLGSDADPTALLTTDTLDHPFWHDDDDGSGELDFKEEDEYTMDLTH